MKDDEIKEILNRLEKIGYYASIPKELAYMATNITPQECKQILDYINNLQHENEELKKNQRYYKNGVFSLEYDKETMSDMIDDYKSRVEKAVEYIGEYKDYCDKEVCDCTPEYFEDLLDILNGRSDE